MTRLSVCLPALLTVTGLAGEALPQRYVWTWDNRMDWVNPGKAVSVMGGGRYTKAPEDFLADYKALVDFLRGQTSFNAIIIWGFLRDAHGGVQASQELCEYARARGIRIIPGVGTSGYEGYYYEGNHRYNITTWLKEHPELRAVNAKGQPHNALCPSQPANIQWLNDGCRWLFSTFQIGGINFEIGDFFVCHCDGCKAARARIPGDIPDYYKDMALSTAPVARLAHELAPDAWLSYATYTGFSPDMARTPPAWVELIPPGIICQWTLTGMVSEAAWPAGLKPPTQTNTGYLHWGNKSTHSVHHFYPAQTQDVCRRAAAAGFVGLATYGEDPDSIFSMKLFYAAWSYFLEHPTRTLNDFAQERLAGWFGGAAEAERLLAIVKPLEEQGPTRGNLAAARGQVTAALAAAATPAARTTWQAFGRFLDGRLAEMAADDRVLAGIEAESALQTGFQVKQGATVALMLPKRRADVLELKVRVHYGTENGLLPVMKLSFNGTPLTPARALDRPAQIATPAHDAYRALASFDTRSGAWRVKYAPDFAFAAERAGKYATPDYRPEFRFRIADLWRDGENRLEVMNLEERFRPSERGVLLVGHVMLE